MEQAHNYTVSEVRDLFSTAVIDTFAATDNGQAHLNRIAKAITNESLDKRLEKQKLTHAKTAFDKEVAKVATKTPERLTELLGRKDAWITNYITKKYSKEEN